MVYINDQKQPHFTYDEAVDAAIKGGVDPKRAYIYLAGLSVRGVLGRVINESGLGYQPPVKLAARGNKLVSKVDFCTKCKGLIIE